MTIDPWLAYAVVAVLTSLGFIAGAQIGKRSRDTDLDYIAVRALHMLREQQRRQHTQAIRQLPPMVSLADVLEHSARTGVAATEAADDLFRRRVKALLAEEMRRQNRTRP